MNQEIIKCLEKTKLASVELRQLEDKQRNVILQDLADRIRLSSKSIILENTKDLINMTSENPLYDRLLLTEERIKNMANDIETVINMDSPLQRILEHKLMENGLQITKLAVPLGVVAIIYESRPNVTIDVFTLCFKTGNACVLKGGKEAHYSNKILVNIINETLAVNNIDSNIIYLLPPNREVTYTILNAKGLIDVCIPRGSKSLIDFVRENARIPVIETGAGIVHVYFDKSGDVKKGRKIIENSKTRRVSVCNALDSLVIHRESLPNLFDLIEPLLDYNVKIMADNDSYQVLVGKYNSDLLTHAKLEDFGQEFLSYKLSIKTVNTIEDAVEHITYYSSGHSEAIIAEDQDAISYFISHIDVAALYVNASTAFTDGGQFGMGAEIGISTQKLHARGPMGLEALTSYKWVIKGNGQIRS